MTEGGKPDSVTSLAVTPVTSPYSETSRARLDTEPADRNEGTVDGKHGHRPGPVFSMEVVHESERGERGGEHAALKLTAVSKRASAWEETLNVHCTVCDVQCSVESLSSHALARFDTAVSLRAACSPPFLPLALLCQNRDDY
ncbi:unnamed protein product [Pleuronectes platessa]|uniref:Uncharacterized protein n=1 Tax=Pleuronectes platessa TaxID=8262 RepID=A0A9N7UK41_PLEPL|nr:unnamed protein product [Pleuronectes platessa]